MANLKDLIVNGSARVIGKLFAQTPASNTNNNEVATTSFVCNVGDNKSISKSSNNKLQAIGVLDAQNTANALKTWTGTKAQYDAIATKDNNTIYHITDDTDITLSLLETLYPVGAIYIGTMTTCPLQVLGVGTWMLKASDMVLQGSGTRAVKETVEAGLPNIEGTLSVSGAANAGLYESGNLSGAFNGKGNSIAGQLSQNSSGTTFRDWYFDASASNSIYGNSDTVQPPAYIVNIWERIS